jgi:hypothetical protein
MLYAGFGLAMSYVLTIVAVNLHPIWKLRVIPVIKPGKGVFKVLLIGSRELIAMYILAVRNYNPVIYACYSQSYQRFEIVDDL